ncbi:MAG: HAD family hydrolase [Armatimonadota bacterium]|nr:HAD family hydrolase [Armatimonadota bacterium]
MITAVLFDLDGTLLPVDTGRLVEEYVRLLARDFADLVDPGRFVSCLLDATRAMLANRDPSRTAREVFAASFYPAVGLTEEQAAPRLAQFYARTYPRLRALTRQDPAAREAVRAALGRGLVAVLATNPIFPEVAIRQRMAWAGVDDLPFAVVTTYETAHVCKPHPEYFLEVCEAIGHPPQRCLMAGNDAREDAVARRLGMRTFLVTDHLINPGGLPVEADRAGSLADLATFLRTADLDAL